MKILDTFLRPSDPVGVSDDELHLRRLMSEARELIRPGCYPMALGKLRQVLAHSPHHVDALDGMAEVYEQLGDLGEAEHYRRRAMGVRDAEWL